MIKFKDSEFVYDVTPSKLIVVEVALDGVFDFNLGARRLLSEFPEVVASYREQCAAGKVSLGIPMYYNWRKFDIALLPVIQSSYGFSKDQPRHIVESIKIAIDNLVEDAGANDFASGKIGEFDNYDGRFAGMVGVLKAIKDSDLNWTIYKE